MRNSVGRTLGRVRAWLGACLLVACWAASAAAQTTTGSIRGTVSAASDVSLEGATVEARNTETGLLRRAPVQQGGFYNVGGLPPGTYQVTVRAAGGQAQTRTVRVLVGQQLTVDLAVTVRTVALDAITAVGDRVYETQTSEVATNVTREQIDALPQGDRNFLNFAQLAPGIRLSNDEQRKTFSGGGLPADQVNLFIDGSSYKNDILQGGVAGQDASRGNPFPQNAIREFRVITENYKAEYQKASGPIITAVTRSGTNRWEGGGFVYGQPNDFVEQDFFAIQRCDQARENNQPCADKPEYQRYQVGFNLGGPIVRDRVHVFGAYEGNIQDRASNVALGAPAPRPDLAQYEGNFGVPFRSHLFFGKLSWQAAANQTLDLSVNLRNEDEERDFGGQRSFESAIRLKNSVNTVALRHELTSGPWLNQASVSFQRYAWNPTPLNPDLVGQEIFGVLRFGGADTEQNFTQDRIALRNDLTLSTSGFLGSHVLKAGASLDFLRYDVQKRLNGNPLFFFRPDSLNMPVSAVYGVGDPDLSANNRQLGLYLQDDWSPTERLLLNLGLRWDYETDMLNNDYVTPPGIADSLSAFLPSSYFTDGDDRPAFLGAVQPRLGFSYDVSGDRRTVFFGGFGLFYDRTTYNAILDEKYRRQYAVRTFRFSNDGNPRDGQPTIIWNPAYLSREGLDALIANGQAPRPEVFLLNNDLEPPYSTQWSLGVRQGLGDFQLSATYTGVRGHNLLTYIRGNRFPANGQDTPPFEGNCCQNVASYSGVLVSDTRRTWYDALYLRAERPYTQSAGWGATLSYTLARAEQNGRDLFSLDKVNADAYGRYASPGDQRHTIVASGIVGLPWDFRASTLISLGSGSAFTAVDATDGFGPDQIQFRAEYPEKQSFIFSDAFAYRMIDLRLERNFSLSGNRRVGVVGELFNAFNFDNFSCFRDFIPPEGNPEFGQPSCTTGNPRRFQLGLTAGF